MQSTNTVQPGFVYVKAHKNSRGLHKIGLTRRPEQREQQLGGDDCRVVARVLVNDPEGLEDRLHRQFDAVRLPQSEWFNLTDEQLREALGELVKAHEQCLQHVVLPDLSEPKPEPKRVQAPARPKAAPKPSRPQPMSADEQAKWDSARQTLETARAKRGTTKAWRLHVRTACFDANGKFSGWRDRDA